MTCPLSKLPARPVLAVGYRRAPENPYVVAADGIRASTSLKALDAMADEARTNRMAGPALTSGTEGKPTDAPR
ncbi:MAG: hypothetical protein ACRDRN_25590 [Sciscionella sp.]